MTKLVVIMSLVFLGCINLGCKTVKPMEKTEIAYNILLKKDQLGEYLSTEYAKYEVRDVKRNSRSKNQYIARFRLTDSERSAMETEMTADEKIVEFSIAKSNGIEVQSSTNVIKN